MNASQSTSQSETTETIIVIDSTMTEEDNSNATTEPQTNNQNSSRTGSINNTLTGIPLPNSPHSSSKSAPRLPAGNQLVKSSQQINDLFRNDYVACINTAKDTPTVSDIINDIGATSPLPLPKILEEKSDDDIIIIDDKDETTEKEDKTIIENVGEEILRLVENNEEGNYYFIM